MSSGRRGWKKVCKSNLGRQSTSRTAKDGRDKQNIVGESRHEPQDTTLSSKLQGVLPEQVDLMKENLEDGPYRVKD